MSETPRWVRAVHQRAHWFKATDKILRVLFEARGGGTLARGLAVMSAIGIGFEAMFPEEGAWSILHTRGYQDTDYCIGGFLCDLLLKSDLPRAMIPAGIGTTLVLWETPAGGVGAIYGGGTYSDGPYLRDGDVDHFIRMLREVAWKEGTDLMLSAEPKSKDTWRAAGKFRLNPMLEPGPYIGKRRPKDFADRLARYGHVPRTILLRGPTGIGKSVLARHIAALMGNGEARTLKIAASILKSCRFDEVLAFVRFFQPTVLLLDDLALNEPHETEEFLTLLEALRAPDCLVIVTMMTRTDPDQEPGLGDWHFPGMRPGRIDEIFTFYLPDAEDRSQILDLYYEQFQVNPKKQTRKAVVKATEGLPGAYLMEVARRLAVHGTKEWKAEVENVRRTAPSGREDEGEDGPDGENHPTRDAEGAESPTTVRAR